MATDKILLVDDDKTLLDVISYNLLKDNLSVITASDGVQALHQARLEKPDLIILDLMLPGLDGFEVCRILRKEMSVPILMLTARIEEVDKVVGLELGADDYMTKPFGMRELVARIKATLRRSQPLQPEPSPEKGEGPASIIQAGNFEVDLSRHEISKDGRLLQLSYKEFEILAFLIRHRGQVFSRDSLVEKLWGHDYIGTARTVDVHICSLRCKIEDNPAEPLYLVTLQCIGYKFVGSQT
jgi:DNA-binding response OmpR family regulator